MQSILRSLALLAATTTIFASMRAQAQTKWPAPTSHSDYGLLEVITVSGPGIRHPCRVHSISTDAITCGIGFARKPVRYQRDNVAALVYAPDHSGEHLSIGLISVAVAGTVASSIFLPPLAAVAIGVPSIYFSLFSAMFADSDHFNEDLLYQRSNTPLTIHLRTH